MILPCVSCRALLFSRLDRIIERVEGREKREKRREKREKRRWVIAERGQSRRREMRVREDKAIVRSRTNRRMADLLRPT